MLFVYLGIVNVKVIKISDGYTVTFRSYYNSKNGVKIFMYRITPFLGLF